jgi:hypothetical protein
VSDYLSAIAPDGKHLYSLQNIADKIENKFGKKIIKTTMALVQFDGIFSLFENNSYSI